MFEVHYFSDNSVTFSRNLIALSDLLTVLGIRQKAQYQNIIKRHEERLSQFPEEAYTNDLAPFGREKEIFVSGNKRKFINLRQSIICVHQAINLGIITSQYGFNFLQWYAYIVESGIEQWYVEKSEEALQDSLIMLAGYGRIVIRQEVTILDNLSDSDKKTRRFDLVEFDNPRKAVRIRELKKHTITINHVREAIEKRRYLELAVQKYPGKQVDFIFCSPAGIEDSASNFIDQFENIYYEEMQELSLRLYLNALDHTPIEGWTYFQRNIFSKFQNILPEQKLLRAAEDVKRQKRK
ncbi:hypothetical protein PL8927_730025 [Planktothrix serta PCC 8927]|uniref:Uncharacterized protein n=1 Tax=Planktothrix serta PCC 8927 TaxID=671068 RepID=A0A7Z9BY58_9CYAN|nr:hypothetical protein [Planktothrix serta]VXD22152.1 hypothetical protein PL8927_730025 [Planktothrix serta PCC 8927]